ncbi:glycosyltransferase family 2 protein [Roseovarius sp.]|uniref:glycosyltransferase family 2 protein n=1 Tax=Roseovarius sp. TaxID=1486281 RepID=UPI003D13C3B3
MTRISIVIPVFNAAHTLPATIAALQDQSFTDWEAILVEDGSADSSWSVARSLVQGDRRLKLVRNPRKGPSAARNHGAIVQSTGDIIAFCDADDIWQRHKLRDVAQHLGRGQVQAVFGRVGFFNEDPGHVRTCSRVPASDVTVPSLLGENPVCTLSNLSLRRDTFESLGGFREDLIHNEDLEFLVHLVGSGHRLVGLETDHVLYRLSPRGLSAEIDRMRAGRCAALETAARFGFRTDPRAEAVHLRYLARRALRVGAPAATVQRLVLEGCYQHASAFLLPARRGGLIALAALLLPFLPEPTRQYLFAN